MKWPLCSSAISRMGCQWLGGMLWQWDLAVTLLGLREVICHSAQRRSPNPLHAPSGCRHLALLGYLPGEGSQTYPIIHTHMLPENECLYYGTALWTASHQLLHSCWVHVWSPWCRYERLSVHNFKWIQQLSPHQLWLPQVPSNASGPRIPPCHPQECASGHKRY